ncbi:hypothetical protein LAUMK191_03091 [Mycobacterium attenuatum]|nr:hypothetical protein LAUMK191_03091 [Mycobacterium attenuatum]
MRPRPRPRRGYRLRRTGRPPRSRLRCRGSRWGRAGLGQGRAGRGFPRTRGLNRWPWWLSCRHSRGFAARLRIGLGQIPAEVLQFAGQRLAGVGDFTQLPATTWRSDTRTAAAFFPGDAFFRSTLAHAQTPGLANLEERRPNVKEVLSQPQSRSVLAPIVEVQQSFPGLRGTVRVQQCVCREGTHRRHIQPLPSGRRTLGIGEKVSWTELVHLDDR